MFLHIFRALVTAGNHLVTVTLNPQGVIYTRPFGTLGYPIMTHPRMEGPNPSCVIIRTGARMPMYGKTSMKGHEGIACLAPIPSKWSRYTLKVHEVCTKKYSSGYQSVFVWHVGVLSAFTNYVLRTREHQIINEHIVCNEYVQCIQRGRERERKHNGTTLIWNFQNVVSLSLAGSCSLSQSSVKEYSSLARHTSRPYLAYTCTHL